MEAVRKHQWPRRPGLGLDLSFGFDLILGFLTVLTALAWRLSLLIALN